MVFDSVILMLNTPVVSISTEEELSATKLKNHFKSISEHKDITKLLMIITSSISSTKAEVMKCIEQFNVYQHIWEGNKENVVKVIGLFHLAQEEFSEENEAKITELNALIYNTNVLFIIVFISGVCSHRSFVV